MLHSSAYHDRSYRGPLRKRHFLSVVIFLSSAFAKCSRALSSNCSKRPRPKELSSIHLNVLHHFDLPNSNYVRMGTATLPIRVAPKEVLRIKKPNPNYVSGLIFAFFQPLARDYLGSQDSRPSTRTATWFAASSATTTLPRVTLTGCQHVHLRSEQCYVEDGLCIFRRCITNRCLRSRHVHHHERCPTICRRLGHWCALHNVSRLKPRLGNVTVMHSPFGAQISPVNPFIKLLNHQRLQCLGALEQLRRHFPLRVSRRIRQCHPRFQ